jgi:hypothetical protein
MSKALIKSSTDAAILKAANRYLEARGAGCDDRTAHRLSRVLHPSVDSRRLDRAIAWRIETITQDKATLPPEGWRPASEIADPVQRANYFTWRVEN